MDQKRPHTTRPSPVSGPEAATAQTQKRSPATSPPRGGPPGRAYGQKATRRPAETGSSPLMMNMDLALAGALAILAAGAAFALPEGNVARMIFTLFVLLVVPGYVLIQAVVGRTRSPSKRMIHLALSLGLSPAIVGLLALATAIIPGGFQPPLIIGIVTLWSIVLAGLAFWRRRVYTDRAPDEQAVPASI